MWWISGKLTWIPLYLTVIYFLVKQYHLKSVVAIISVILAIALSDQISVHCFKEVFQRLRPCHNPMIADMVHTVNNKCGGQYGFVSSHASNSFSFAVITVFFFRNRTYTISIIIWAAIVSYSRIYLGVHYPGDVLGGALLGVLIGSSVFYGTNLLLRKLFQNK